MITSVPRSSTGGMGEEWAQQLAVLGFNLILQGRNRSKLEAVSADILKTTPEVEIHLLVTEATIYPNDLLTRSLTTLLEDPTLRLQIVINNLGTVSTGFPLLEEETSDTIAQVIISNSIFPAEISRITLPHLKRNQPSLLANVTSMGAWACPPYLSPYIGTKGFDVAFSQSLYNEMAISNNQVDVVCLVPGQVVSGMHVGPESLMVPSSKEWTRQAIQSLRPGWFSSQPKGLIIPYRWHYWANWITSFMPRWVTDEIAKKVARGLKQEYIEEQRKTR